MTVDDRLVRVEHLIIDGKAGTVTFTPDGGKFYTELFAENGLEFNTPTTPTEFAANVRKINLSRLVKLEAESANDSKEGPAIRFARAILDRNQAAAELALAELTKLKA